MVFFLSILFLFFFLGRYERLDGCWLTDSGIGPDTMLYVGISSYDGWRLRRLYSDNNGDDHDDDDVDDGSSDRREQQQPQNKNDNARSTDLRHDGNKRWSWLTFQRHSIEILNWIINTFIANTNCSSNCRLWINRSHASS